MDLRTIGLIAFLLAAMIGTPPAFAQDSTPAEEDTADRFVPVTEPEETKITITDRDQYTMESDVNRQSGQISVNQNDFTLQYDTKAFDVLPLTFFFDYRHLDINENLPVNLPSHLEGRRLGAGVKLPMPFTSTEEHFIGIDVMPSWYTDDWTWTNSSFRMPFRIYGIYRPDDNFVFIAGATIRPDYDTVVVPVIGFNWQPNDRWDIHLASTEPTVTYKINENWAIFGEYNGSLDEYEVTRNGQKGVVLKVSEFTLGGGLKYHINKKLEASFSAGANLARRFQYRDDVGKVDADSAPYIKFRLSSKF